MAEDRMLNDEILLGLIKANSGGGGGGTTDYEDLDNLPKVNNVELKGNKSLSDLGIASAQSVSNITNGENINNFAGVENALEGKQDALTAGANINMAGDVVKAGVIEVVEPDMTVYGNSTESGSKTYTIETTGVYEIFYCLSLQSTVSVTLPNDANVLFENDLTISSHPVKHIVAELHEGDTVTIAQTPNQWNAVISGVLKLDAISVVDVAHTGSVADNTITYTLPNDNKYYLVVGACAGKPTGNNAVDSTSGGNAEITRTLTGSGVRFRSVVVKGSDSPNFSFYGYDGGVAAVIAYEIEFEEGNWDYNLATKNYVDTALATKQDKLTFDDTPTDGSNNPVKSNGIYDALALKQNATDNNLDTDAKTIVGAINEHEGDISSLKSGLTNLDNEVNGDATVYPYADVITIEDAVPANLADCSVKIEPVQDLHGQSAPYVGGAGKNKLPMTVDSIKALNSGLTWNGNTAIKGGVPFTILTDSDNNVLGIKALGTSTEQIWYFTVAHITTTETLLFNTGNTYSWDGNKIVCEVTNGTNTYHASTLNGVEVPPGTYDVIIAAQNNAAVDVTFLPMLRATTETDATFAPYTNICPISGHTEVDVQRTGANLAFDTISGKNIKANGVIINADFDLKVARVASGVTYTAYTDDSSSVYAFYSDSPASGSTSYNNSRTETIVSNSCFEFTAPIDGYIAYRTNEGYARTECVESSKNNQYTIALGDTIYGGTVDFDSGVMTVDRAIDTLTSLNRTNDHSFYKPPTTQAETGQTTIDKVLCDRLPTGNIEAEDSLFINNSGNVRINTTQAFSTAEEAMAYLGGSYTLTYRIATPFTVQLTPQQIQLLKGTNTLYASTGQISVTANGVSGAIGSVQEQVNGLRTDLSKGYLVKTFNVDGHANDTSIDFSALKPSDYNGFVNAYSCNGSGAVIQKCKNDVIYFVEALGIDATITIVYTVSQ